MSVRVLFCFAFLIFGCASVAHAALSVDHVQLGDQRPGRQLSASAHVENDSATAVTILRQVRNSANRVLAPQLPLTIAPHASADLKLDIHINQMLGAQTYYAEFALDSEQKSLRVIVNAFVDSALDGEPIAADFGLVAAGKEADRRIDLTSRDLPDLRAQAAEDQDKLIDAEIIDGGKALTLRTRRDAPWGRHEGWIQIATTSKAQPMAWIKYSFETRGRVVPESYKVDAGVQRLGNVQPQTLFIRDTEGDLLELGKITQRGAPVLVNVTDCPVKARSCRGLELKVDDDKFKDGRFSTELSIDLPKYKQKLVVNYFGRMLAPDGKIVDLNAIAEAQTRDIVEQHDLGTALKAVTRPEPAPIVMPIPEGNGPLLKWSVQNEQQIYGYIVYRADSEDGRLQRVSDKIIRTVSQQDNVPVEYFWRDATAQPGRTYWYQIGTVDPRGIRADLTGRAKKVYSDESVKAK